MRNSRLVLDVSNVAPITAAQVRASGCVALIAKETEGTSYRDGTAARHRDIARAVGIPFGGYLFLRMTSHGSEADAFLRYAQLRPGDIQPIIDAETRDGRSMAQVAARIDAEARELERHGYRPILYASSSWWLEIHRNHPSLRRLRVWEAQYPGRFTRWTPRLARLRVRLRHGATVVLWQWTSSYDVQGRHFDASRLMVPLRTLLIQRKV